MTLKQEKKKKRKKSCLLLGVSNYTRRRPQAVQTFKRTTRLWEQTGGRRHQLLVFTPTNRLLVFLAEARSLARRGTE